MLNNIPSPEALSVITERLFAYKIDFALGGTGLLYALGLIDEVKDWDMAVDCPIEKITVALKGLDWVQLPQTELFKSNYLLKVLIKTTSIDLIGGFSISTSNGIHKVPVKISKYWNNTPLADPKDWLIAYKLMGHHDKAIRLENFLKNHSAASEN